MSFSARPYRLPLNRPYKWAKGAHSHRAGLILRLDQNGVSGWGEVAFGPHVAVDGERLKRDVLGLVAGLDASSDGFLEALDRRAPHNRIRAAIACAWFSARAAAAGQPLNRFLAPHATPAAAIPINGLVGEPDVAGALAQAAGFIGQGMKTLKIKCFADVARDVERVGAIRAALPDIALRLDPNDAWKTVEDALRALERLAPLGIDYVEDPLDTHRATLDEMVRIRRLSPVAIAWDNPVQSLADMKRIHQAGAVDVFIFKMPRAGGPDRQLAMIDYAAAEDLRMVMTSPIETAIGTVAGLHVTSLCPPPIADSGFSLSALFARDVAAPPAVIDGFCAVPEAPGLGVAPDGAWTDAPIA
jgi:o-succinylbenzoate synthase